MMRDQDYYPPGAYYDENAPYNQTEPPECEFEISVSFVLERNCTITTDEVYYDEDCWELCDDADVDKAYDWEYIQIPDMLNELAKYAKAEAEMLKKSIKAKTANAEDKKRYQYLKRVIDSAEGWEITDRDHERL